MAQDFTARDEEENDESEWEYEYNPNEYEVIIPFSLFRTTITDFAESLSHLRPSSSEAVHIKSERT
jgi:hypothetical protein